MLIEQRLCLTPQSDMGHLGCAADVTSVLDRTCSGLQQCQVPVDDERLRKTAPCAEELTWYLLASYSCVNGEYPC